jgi:hypothetical protein
VALVLSEDGAVYCAALPKDDSDVSSWRLRGIEYVAYSLGSNAAVTSPDVSHGSAVSIVQLFLIMVML